MEAVDDSIGQKYPAGSQVTGRVSRTHVAKVDHAAEIAVFCQEISRVQVRVQPQSRTCPVRRRQRIIPDLAYGVRVGKEPTIGCLLQEMCEAFADVGQQPPSAARTAAMQVPSISQIIKDAAAGKLVSQIIKDAAAGR